MALVDICGQSGPECVTVDYTSPNRALDNARTAFFGALNHHTALNHQTTAEAVSNLVQCLTNKSTKRVMIVGHGWSGQIITGTGEQPDTQNASISIATQPIWTHSLPDLKGIDELIFCSCDTAAPDEGPVLLQRVALEIGARVSGFTGMIYIDDQGQITCGKSGYWRYADASGKLSPLPEPTFVIKAIEVNMVLKLRDDGDFTIVPVSDVSAFRYFDPVSPKLSVRSSSNLKGLAPEPRFSLKGEEAQRLAATINFAEEEEIAGAPLAIVTGRVEIDYILGEEQGSRSFIVYNHRLLQDQLAPNTFYYALDNFKAAISEHLG